jgi:hypothetical protein
MSSISYIHNDGDEFVTEQVTTDAQTAEIRGHLPYRVLRLSLADGQLANDGTAKETVTVKVVDGLEVARGTDPVDATVLDHDGNVTVTVDGVETTKAITNGSMSFDVTTEKSAGSTIEVVAESLADHPAESDKSIIEVIQS